MDIRLVTSGNLHVYMNLCQAYEGEFSAITGKLPGVDGVFPLDTELRDGVQGYLLYSGDAPADLAPVGFTPVGFAAIRTCPEEGSEVCEFYIVPSLRRKSLGRDFAHRLFAMHPGRWQVKQLQDAGYATRFWVRVIGEFTRDDFTQDFYDDAYWGRVMRQCFLSPGAGS